MVIHQPYLTYTNRFLAILGLLKTATHVEIKQSYYKLAQIYHPDKNSSPGAKEKFAQISQ